MCDEVRARRPRAARLLDEGAESVGRPLRVDAAAAAVVEHDVEVAPACSGHQAAFVLGETHAAEHGDGGVVDRHDTAPAVLRCRHGGASVEFGPRPAGRDRVIVVVDVTPFDAECFTAAASGVKQEPPQFGLRVVGVVDVREEPHRLDV